MGVFGDKLAFALLRASFVEQGEFGNISDNPKVIDMDLSGFREKLSPETLQRIGRRYIETMVQQLTACLAGEKDTQVQQTNMHTTPDQLSKTLDIFKHYLSSEEELASAMNNSDLISRAIRFQLLEWKQKIMRVEDGKDKIGGIFSDRNDLYDTLQVLKVAHGYDQWINGVKLIEGYFFPGSPEDLLKNTQKFHENSSIDSLRRNTFYIDRLINLAHFTGELTEHISNNYPLMSLILTLHSAKNSFQLLWNYSSSTLKNELTGRSNVLMRGKAIPTSSGYNDEERQAIISKIHNYPEGSYYRYGIQLASDDKEIKNAATLSGISNEDTIKLAENKIWDMLQRVDKPVMDLRRQLLLKEFIFSLPESILRKN